MIIIYHYLFVIIIIIASLFSLYLSEVEISYQLTVSMLPHT